MKKFRKLTDGEVARLQAQMCTATDWSQVEVSEDFTTEHVRAARLSGRIRLGSFSKEFTLAGGIRKHSGVYYATLHNVTVGDDCCIENIRNYIANYEIGDGSFIENVDVMLTDGPSAFGNGVEVSVLNETGGREVTIYDRLSAQEAYVMALYRHRPEVVAKMREMILSYASLHSSDTGKVGQDAVIVDAGYIKNVNIGDCCKIEGAARLKNGSINSNASAPVHIGVGVIGDDFIISSGSSVDDGVTFSRCFIGQACILGHNYSASDALFFSNCQGENGEACAIFAGPFTVTHHKSTLLIAGMFSFMNAGSGSNQSNHMYKLGPIHQGIMERGAKTASDSYILWPAKVGAFSLVMGRHVSHQDTSDFPFSYLIEQQNTTYLVPGVNLKSVGTIRDAKKWPKRDKRADPDKLDSINYNLLSPYTAQKMLAGLKRLKDMKKVSGESSEIYSFQSAKIKHSALEKGIRFYNIALNKFFGNSVIKRLEGLSFASDEDVRKALVPDFGVGAGRWADLSGMLAPKSAIDGILDGIENGSIDTMSELESRFSYVHNHYYGYEWTWVYDKFEEFYGIDPKKVTAADVIGIVRKWKEAVTGLDRMVYEDAKKEFALSFMTSFGADGDKAQKELDFIEVRGSDFDSNPFVREVLSHIERKSALGDELIGRLQTV